MRDKDRSREASHYVASNILERRRVHHIAGLDSMDVSWTYVSVWIDKCRIFIQHVAPWTDAKGGDLDHAVFF
jgi:hypothetical protein